MDFKYFVEKAPLMTPDSLDKLHLLVFKIEGASFLARQMVNLEIISSCVYCFMKEEKGSGTHVISGSYNYGFSKLDVEITCNWNEGVPNVCLIFWPREGEIDTIVEVIPVETLFYREQLEAAIKKLISSVLPEINSESIKV